MQLYDGSFRDVCKRLKDDDLVSLKLLKEASNLLMRYGLCLEMIQKFGRANPDCGFDCSTIAKNALENK